MERPFDPGDLHEVRSVDASKALADVAGPAIIVSASGMATGGRVLHHLEQRHRFQAQLEAAPLDAREVEQIGDQEAETLGVAVDRVDEARAVRFRFNGWGEKYVYPDDDTVADRLAEHEGLLGRQAPRLAQHVVALGEQLALLVVEQLVADQAPDRLGEVGGVRVVAGDADHLAAALLDRVPEEVAQAATVGVARIQDGEGLGAAVAHGVVDQRLDLLARHGAQARGPLPPRPAARDRGGTSTPLLQPHQAHPGC